MTKCAYCNKTLDFLPSKCSYCGGYYCKDHRLPENHRCEYLNNVHKKRQIDDLPIHVPSKSKTFQPYEEQHDSDRYPFFEGSFLEELGRYFFPEMFPPITTPKPRYYVSRDEMIHLSIAGTLIVVLGVFWFINAPIIPVFVLVTAFLGHELMHKFTAQHYGLWAEFRLERTGAMLTALSIFSPLIKIIAPGAVFISGSTSDPKVIGKIAISGPLTNFILALISLPLFLLVRFNPFIITFISLMVLLNALIGIINLLPFGMFDGYKIYRWNKRVWITLVIGFIMIFFIYETMLIII